MIQYPCFDDVLLQPVFSKIRSRQDVDPTVEFLNMKLFPVTNSNMDTVASPALSKVLHEYGAISTIHRFCSIRENVKLFEASVQAGIKPIVSIGVGNDELDRACALEKAGAYAFMLDVAHAANTAVVEMYVALTRELPKASFIVGNFGTGEELTEFIRQLAMFTNDLTYTAHLPYAVCVGIGGGSMCLTRVVTGVGMPTLASILECAPICEDRGMKLMVNGGLRNSGDIAKALAAGADLIMLGSMFAGTNEASGDECTRDGVLCKEYRGSASLPSYHVQGKVASWRAPEGDRTWLPVKGPAINVLNNINGGLRSAMSYLNATNIDEFRVQAKFIEVSSNTVLENKAHGK